MKSYPNPSCVYQKCSSIGLVYLSVWCLIHQGAFHQVYDVLSRMLKKFDVRKNEFSNVTFQRLQPQIWPRAQCICFCYISKKNYLNYCSISSTLKTLYIYNVHMFYVFYYGSVMIIF